MITVFYGDGTASVFETVGESAGCPSGETLRCSGSWCSLVNGEPVTFRACRCCANPESAECQEAVGRLKDQAMAQWPENC